MELKTEQEEFWSGDFGNEYIGRNDSEHYLASNVNFFAKALSSIQKPASIIEFGANIGMNLKAVRLLFPDIAMSAIEINQKATALVAEVVEVRTRFTTVRFSIIHPWKDMIYA